MDAFEKLDVWKRSARMCVEVFKALENTREFSFRDQIFRASLSIPSNIAEGYERGSPKEFKRFLGIAKGSCAEVRAQLYIGRETKILPDQLARTLIRETRELSKMLQGLIKTLKTEQHYL